MRLIGIITMEWVSLRGGNMSLGRCFELVCRFRLLLTSNVLQHHYQQHYQYHNKFKTRTPCND